MFLQSLLEKRLIQLEIQENDMNNKHRDSKFSKLGKSIIGSKKHGMTEFQYDMEYFGKETVRSEIRQVKEQMKEEQDPDFLGLKQQKWNKSTMMNKYGIQGIDNKTMKFEIRNGYHDAFPNTLKNKDNPTWAGTETRDKCYYGWDKSTESPNHRDKERMYQNERYHIGHKMLNKTDRIIKNQKNERITSGVQISRYISPDRVQAQINENMRNQKSNQESDWNDELDKAAYLYPRASPERLNAVVFKQLHDRKRSVQQPIDEELTFKPKINNYKSQRMRGRKTSTQPNSIVFPSQRRSESLEDIPNLNSQN